MHRTSQSLTFLFLVAICTAHGQDATFVGVVTDSLTGEPLAGAYVSLVDEERTFVTSVDGRFELGGVRTGDVTVQVRRPGFRAGSVHLEITVTRAATVDLGTIVLSPVVVELDPVMVEGTAVDRKLTSVGFFHPYCRATEGSSTPLVS